MLDNDKICFRTNYPSKVINNKILLNGFTLINSSFENYIYMTNVKLDYKNIENIDDIGSYVIIQNCSEKKKIILKEHGLLQTAIVNVASTKELLFKLGFHEFMNININICTYKRDNICINTLAAMDKFTYIYGQDNNNVTKIIYDFLETNKLGFEYKEYFNVRQDMFKLVRDN